MESVKMKKATKTVAFRQLAIYCNIVDNQLLTDAKIPKYIPQHLVRSHFTHYIGEMENALPEVLRDEVAGEAGGEACLHTADGGEGTAEGFVVAHVGDDDVGLADAGQVG